MIHTTEGQKIEIIGTTEESRFNTSVPTSNLMFLIKFTNEYSNKILYSYATNVEVRSRYTKLEVNYNAINDAYRFNIDLQPLGYWKYEVFEVSFIEMPTAHDITNTPETEDTILDVRDEYGIVEGRVDIGKLKAHSSTGAEEVVYNQNVSEESIYIYSS